MTLWIDPLDNTAGFVDSECTVYYNITPPSYIPSLQYYPKSNTHPTHGILVQWLFFSRHSGAGLRRNKNLQQGITPGYTTRNHPGIYNRGPPRDIQQWTTPGYTTGNHPGINNREPRRNTMALKIADLKMYCCNFICGKTFLLFIGGLSPPEIHFCS